MQKICALIFLSALIGNYEAVPQTKWSRPIRNPPGQLTRERRQFPFGEWIPLSQPCPTCRPFADPLDAGLRGESIGLTPPRPPTVTRQIHGEGNFFPQDESSILSVPPPPPSAIPRHPNGNFQFSSFGQQFNNPLPVPNQKIFPQTQQIQFLPQTFLTNQPLLVNGNQQILTGLNAQNSLFSHEHNQQQVNNGKVAGFNSEFKSQKIPENVVLEQNKRPVAPKQAFSNKPQPFTPQQQNQQTFVKQQTFNGQQQHSVNFANSILTPPPAPKNISQDIVIPGLDKEEIQLLYVPVETLRQRGTPQEQLLTQQPQNVQFFNQQNGGAQRPVNNVRPTQQTIINQPKGHFITQNGNNQGQADSSLKVTSTQAFPTTVTPSTLLLQHLPFQQTPQPFVSATPATPTIQPFVTPASAFQKFSPFTPETTLPYLSTVANTVQFSQSDIEFGTTPKTVTTKGGFTEEIITGKPQFAELKGTVLTQGQGSPIQPFPGQEQSVTQQPQISTVFSQEQQKDVITPTHFPHQIDQHQINLQNQQEQQRLLQQQRQKELEEQRFLEQQRKQKELEEQRLLQQQQKQKEFEQQRFLQKQKELEEQRLQQQRQKELEQQRFLQKQKEIEEQRLLQQRRQKELEQQRFFQKQKELEEQRLLQQRQKELEEQRFLQEQKQKELENQRRLQLQRQRELEEKRRLQLKQKEEEARIIQFQQQQKELEQQRLLQRQQEEQQRVLQQQKLQKQKQENLKKQQQFQFLQQQQQQQQSQQQQKQGFQQGNRHVLPANDNLNFIPQLEKESEPEDQHLVPHQPPLSVFFKGQNGATVKITDVLRELRSSNTITVLDQYFEKMPTVFVGPAGLIPPTGYGKFDLPYLSNIESNRIERRIDKLPFFVAPLNFVPPPGYAKIPFPAPHVGSVVVSSESNPAMNVKAIEKGSSKEVNSGSFPVVGPELPGLINNLDTITTTIKPTTYTPSLPQTTAQLRNRRPNNSLYKPQTRKPITRTRPTTTSKPEEEVTQPIQKAEITKDSEGGFRKPFNRFLNRRRQQSKSTTETPLKSQQDGKNFENRHYTIDAYQQEKNQFSRTQQKSDTIEEKPAEGHFNRHFEQSSNIGQITPSGEGVFGIRPTPELSKVSQIESEGRPEISDYSDVNLQSYEDGPLPTGSAKTITHELYRPNSINRAEEVDSKTLSKPDSTQSSIQFQSSVYDDVAPTKFSDISDASPTASAEGQVNVEPTSAVGYESQEGSSERFDTTEASDNKVSNTPNPTSGEQYTKGFLDSNEQYTSAFAEISKPHHIPGFVDSSKRQQSSVYPTSQISVDLETPFAQNQHSQEYDESGEVRPTNSAQVSVNTFTPTGSSNEQYITGFEGVAKGQQSLDASTSQVSPTAPGATDGQYTTGFLINSQSSSENNKQYEDQRIGSFINVDFQGTSSTDQYNPSPSAFPSQATESEQPIIQPQVSSTPETVAEVTVNPSVQTYTTSEGLANVSEQTTEGHGQDVADNLANDHRLKLPNPSIVRVRTRVRGKSRGQVNFAASQTTTQTPFIRSTVENRHLENTEQESTTKSTHFREYNPVKISKFRGVKKPVRSTTTTTESTAEYEQKSNVYTVRPHRRPLNPSTVSTKRIRRPTTPLPSAEGATEAFGVSTAGSYSQSEHSDISPSGVSNDVYYEQSSVSPIKHKFRKHFGTAEQKNDVVPSYISTSHPSVAPTYATAVQDVYSEESHVVKDLTHTEVSQEENSDKYPEWNPSDSGFDVSGIVLTTTRTPGQEEQQTELEEPKKSQESKKAFDPDLEKKTGRRRVRVRVHKRPHENFETAESQNLRTVANVLVPPTTTYKPNDESSFHQLAKNADFSFGGQKLFGIRSREYFRKRLNLTEGVSTGKGEQTASENAADDASEKPVGTKIIGFLRKAHKNEFDTSQANETSEAGKVVRPKFRGFVRKIVKHGGASKETDSEPNQVTEEENEKHESGELHLRQPFRVNQGGFNHTARVNGTRHKTFVRYVKKNKIRQHEDESHQESNIEAQKEDQGQQQTTESHTEGPQQTESQNTEDVREENVESQFQVYHSTEQQQNSEHQEQETTEVPETKQQSSTQSATTESAEAYESSSHVFKETTPQHPTPLTQLTGLYLTQRPKFYQTLRPVYQRTSGFHRTRESESHSSTTEQSVQEPQEKRSGFVRLKYGKTTGFGTTISDKSDETKKVTEQQFKNKNQHSLEVRKYLRTKTREGAFSQFSRNKYFTSEKAEAVTTAKDQENEPEEITTERAVETSSVEPKTTQAVASRTESVELETTENDEEENELTSTTEAISSTEEESSEEDVTSSVILDTTTETEIPTTAYRATSSSEIPTTIYQTPSSPETPEVTDTKTTIQTTEAVETHQTEYEPDIYRFSKHSFSFDEAEHFTGTKNRAHVRNITTDIIENTASFSAPGVEKRPDIRVVTHRSDEGFPATDSTQNEKTEVTTELNGLETTTEYPETTESRTTASTADVTKAKVAKILKTSTTTKISHETEICYRGKCIRTKSENPDEDLKLLVDSASTMKIPKAKRGT